jgi:hypothetical protein
VTLASLLFPIFGLALCLSSQHPHTLNNMQYLADEDVGKSQPGVKNGGPGAQILMLQVPKSQRHVSPFQVPVCVHLGLSVSPTLNRYCCK